MIIIYIILFSIFLGCLFWLASRISHESQVGAYTSFLVLPAFYWTFKYWNSRRAALRVPAMATFGVLALTILIFLVARYIDKSRIIEQGDTTRQNPAMMKWCREQNDGIYDPVLKVCVEPGKADVMADEAKENSMGQFEQYLNQHGLAGAMDRTETPAIKALKESPDVADAASFRLNGQAADQAPLMIALCLSHSACEHLATRQKKDPGNIGFSKGRLMLLLPPEADEARQRSAKSAVAGFVPAAS
ncbi:MAG: hypothetical protein JO002_07220 [Burkholderiaceae bacterium]|nr:hypothetical protein [Burkholderiaceae bacterium]